MKYFCAMKYSDNIIAALWITKSKNVVNKNKGSWYIKTKVVASKASSYVQ